MNEDKNVESKTELNSTNKKESIFKRVDKKALYNNFSRIISAKTAFNGKPFKVHILAKDIVRYNAKLITEKLRVINTKHCLAIKKLIDSCMANARFFGIDDSKLCIRSINVGSGQRPRRIEFKGRRRTGMQRPARSKVEIKLQEVNFG